AIFELSAIHCRVLPVESHEFPSPVERPPFSVLNKSKIKNAFGLEIPHWREGVKRCLELLKKE
ncbi:MAG: sugar nucleotide-binding protein, partial [Lewinella sp.]|nr:sugar nucleotide-binding protein [Lewinella sp.]